jgi:hypothetical protein
MILADFLTGIGFATTLTIIAFGLFVLILPLIALVDILRNEFTDSNKLIWVIVVLFFPFLGAIIYFVLGSSHKIR